MNAKLPETWLFDLGNSRLKAARVEGGEPVDVLALDWETAEFDAALDAALATWPAPDAVWVASVASNRRAGHLRAALQQVAAGRTHWLHTPRAGGGVTNGYARPERLGIDRFLAMVAAHARAPGTCVVVGCGTALTLDLVAADGRHVDGMITLSPGGMLQALRGATAIADGNPDAFAEGAADDTARALQAGCWASAGALVQWFLARGRRGHGVERVLLHGGWADELAAWLAHDGLVAEVLDHAVLHGLATWAVSAAAATCSADER